MIKHHVQRIEYSKLRVTRQYENDRATVTVETGLIGNENSVLTETTIENAILEGKRVCDKALQLVDPSADQALIADAMKTEDGLRAVKAAAENVVRLRNRKTGDRW